MEQSPRSPRAACLAQRVPRSEATGSLLPPVSASHPMPSLRGLWHVRAWVGAAWLAGPHAAVGGAGRGPRAGRAAATDAAPFPCLPVAATARAQRQVSCPPPPFPAAVWAVTGQAEAPPRRAHPWQPCLRQSRSAVGAPRCFCRPSWAGVELRPRERFRDLPEPQWAQTLGWPPPSGGFFPVRLVVWAPTSEGSAVLSWRCRTRGAVTTGIHLYGQ